MSLLPDVERELMRVARAPEPVADGLASGARPRRRPRPRLGSGVIRSLPAAGLVLIVVAAVAVGGVFLAGLRSGRGGGSGPALSGGAGGGFPGAPSTQRGDWKQGEGVCPLAHANRYLPPRSGCVSVARAEMYAGGREDLVLVYARLSDRRVGKLYVPRYFILDVVRPGGAAVRTRLERAESNPAILFAGHAGFDHAASVFIVNEQISSGASAVVYSVAHGRLVSAGVRLAFGGDSADKATFACRAGQSPTVVQRTWILSRGGENGWWWRTDRVFAWSGARLIEISHMSMLRHGAVVPAPPGGCTTATRRHVRAPSRVVNALLTNSPACSAAELSTSVASSAFTETGEHDDVFVIRNTSRRICSLSGYAKVLLIHRASPLPFVYRAGGGPYVTTTPPRTVKLSPGGLAYILVAQRACVGRVRATAEKVLIHLSGMSIGDAVGASSGVHEFAYCTSRRDPGNLVTLSPVEPTLGSLGFTSNG